MSAGFLVIIPVCPGGAGCHQGARASRGAGGREARPRSNLGRFPWPQATEASRLLVRFAEAEQCLHFIPLLLLCVVCLVNSRRQRFKSRMAVPLLQFCWLVFVTQSP